MNRRMDNVLEFLEESAAKYPDKAVFADETQEITYREFVRRARRMATGLQSVARREVPWRCSAKRAWKR